MFTVCVFHCYHENEAEEVKCCMCEKPQDTNEKSDLEKSIPYVENLGNRGNFRAMLY